MNRADLRELQYIAPMRNVPSIAWRGILSHRLAAKVAHDSVAMEAIQDRRAKVVVPGGRPLHDYVNLYICARNPMLRRVRGYHLDLCVLRVRPEVLDLPGVVVTDRNASSGYARFAPAPRGLAVVDRALTFAEYWTDPDEIVYYQKKSAKCAEVLVPDRVDPSYIIGAYVSCDEALVHFNGLGVGATANVDGHLFFV